MNDAAKYLKKTHRKFAQFLQSQQMAFSSSSKTNRIIFYDLKRKQTTSAKIDANNTNDEIDLMTAASQNSKPKQRTVSCSTIQSSTNSNTSISHMRISIRLFLI